MAVASTRLAIVTGGNKGIGYATVKALCERFDGVVYLTARDVGRGEAAVAQLAGLGLRPRFHQLDVTDAGSVATFAAYVADRYGGIDVLVNNAAIVFLPGVATEPYGVQAEETIRVNYFALRTVCDALFPLLLPGARVVNLSSSKGRLSLVPGAELRRSLSSPLLTVDGLDALMRRFVADVQAGISEQSGWPSFPYIVAKVGVTALTFLQQKMFDVDHRTDIVINSVHPGYVDTDMTDHMGPLTIEQGAEAPVYLALLPAGEEKVKGCYVWCDKTVKDWRE